MIVKRYRNLGTDYSFRRNWRKPGNAGVSRIRTGANSRFVSDATCRLPRLLAFFTRHGKKRDRDWSPDKQADEPPRCGFLSFAHGACFSGGCVGHLRMRRCLLPVDQPARPPPLIWSSGRRNLKPLSRRTPCCKPSSGPSVAFRRCTLPRLLALPVRPMLAPLPVCLSVRESELAFSPPRQVLKWRRWRNETFNGR